MERKKKKSHACTKFFIILSHVLNLKQKSRYRLKVEELVWKKKWITGAPVIYLTMHHVPEKYCILPPPAPPLLPYLLYCTHFLSLKVNDFKNRKKK